MAERASGKRRDGTFDKPEKGWFYVEEWGLSLARPNSPDSVAEPQTSPTHRVEEEASMLPAWRQSFLKKLEAKAAKDDFDDFVRYNWADKLARPEAPSGLMATALSPLGEQIWRKDTKTTAQKKAHDLRRVFDRIDKDRDGRLSSRDLAKQLRELGCKPLLSDCERMVFESDDDGDGFVGWEEFSNLWVRMKKPLGPEEAGMPMALFNLMDFLHQDMIYGNDASAINSNKALQLFHYRYQRVAALEVMDDVSVGETGDAGVDYPTFLQRDQKLRAVMFTTNRYGALQKQDLQELHVSHGGGMSGTLRRTRPPTPCEIPFAKTASRASATDRKVKPRLIMSIDQLFEGFPLKERSESRLRSFSRGQLESSVSGLGETTPGSSRSSTPASGHRRRRARKKAERSPSRSSTSVRGSQMSRIPKMSDKLRESRNGPRVTAGVEVRTAVDTSFAAKMDISISPGEEVHVAVIYGPIVVMNELGRKAIKVGSLGAGEVVPVFEKDLDMEGGVKLRTSLGWFSTMAPNGRLAVEKLSGPEDPRHPTQRDSRVHIQSSLSGILPTFSAVDEGEGSPVGDLGGGDNSVSEAWADPEDIYAW